MMTPRERMLATLNHKMPDRVPIQLGWSAEVTAAVSLGGLAVPAGQLVRWVVTSAPAIEDSAWKVAVLLTAAVQV